MLFRLIIFVEIYIHFILCKNLLYEDNEDQISSHIKKYLRTTRGTKVSEYQLKLYIYWYISTQICLIHGCKKDIFQLSDVIGCIYLHLKSDSKEGLSDTRKTFCTN